jgi:subtilisin family serine protease
MALFVRAANYLSNSYNSYTGTSFAAPIIAGGLALIIEAHPDWNVSTLIYNLRKTATNADYPNNDLGWGIARFYNMYSGEIPLPEGKRFFVAPNPAFNSVTFNFDPPLTWNGVILLR